MARPFLLAGLSTLVLAAAIPGGAGADSEKAKADMAPAARAEIGNKAPEFTLSDLNGKEIALSDFAGKIVVLEWTNPDCPVVQRHYKAHTMASLAKEYGEKGVIWLAINSTHNAGLEKNKAWAEEQKIAYPILDDASGEVGHLYGAQTTPHMYVIDAQGMLVYAGAIDDSPRGDKETMVNYVGAALEAVLSGAKVANAQTKPYGCSVKYAQKAEASKTSAS